MRFEEQCDQYLRVCSFATLCTTLRTARVAIDLVVGSEGSQSNYNSNKYAQWRE